MSSRSMRLRALDKTATAIAPLQSMVTRMLESVRDAKLAGSARVVLSAFNHASRWLRDSQEQEPAVLEAGARRFAITLGRAMELALLIRHAQWSQEHENDGSSISAASRFARSGVDLIG